MSEKKWKIVAAFLVVIIILQASLISDYKEKADEKHEERLERLILWSIGGHFRQLTHPLVFESYPCPYPITPERAKELKLQNLTEGNVDAFLFELYYRSGGPRHHYNFLLDYRWADLEMGPKLAPLYYLLMGYEEKIEAVSRMTNKAEKKEALEELSQNTHEDFGEIAYCLSYGGNLSSALEIATNGSAREYLDQPIYPIKVGVGKYEREFWVKNNWNKEINISSPPYVILKEVVGYSTVDWEWIYEPTGTCAVILRPGEEKVWVWDQKYANNTQATAGLYKVVFSVDGWAEGTYKVNFRIEC